MPVATITVIVLIAATLVAIQVGLRAGILRKDFLHVSQRDRAIWAVTSGLIVAGFGIVLSRNYWFVPFGMAVGFIVYWKQYYRIRRAAR
jgi:hypothetical protein